MVLQMVRAGLFGELTHGACAYNHDLRSILFSKEGEGLTRRKWYLHPLLSPVYSLPHIRVKEPLYVNDVALVYAWLHSQAPVKFRSPRHRAQGAYQLSFEELQ